MLLALRSLWDVSASPTLPNQPGRVIKGRYPYWTSKPIPPPDRSPLYWQPEEEATIADEEELFAVIAMD